MKCVFGFYRADSGHMHVHVTVHQPVCEVKRLEAAFEFQRLSSCPHTQHFSHSERKTPERRSQIYVYTQATNPGCDYDFIMFNMMDVTQRSAQVQCSLKS